MMSATAIPGFSAPGVSQPHFGAGYKAKTVIAWLTNHGFHHKKSNGGHQQFEKPGVGKIPVPVHGKGNGEFGAPLIARMAKQLNLSPQEFRKQLDTFA